MFFLTALEQRIIVVSITQLWPILYGVFFTYKLLKRSKNYTTISLSSFFITQCIAFLVLIFSIFTVNTPFSFAFYIVGYFLYFFSFTFLIVFSWLVLNVDKKVRFKSIFFIIICYSITSGFLIWIGIFIDGLRYSYSTNWVPVFSLEFAILSWIYIGLGYFLPEVIIINSLRITFKNTPIKNRIYLLIISLLLGISLAILPILYNYLIDNTIYRTIHTFIALPLSTISAYIIYRSLGKGFSKH
ncbi:MAG: hypothetical protein ACFFKA_17475 [Candidatus Thorarchaeota archaeon]